MNNIIIYGAGKQGQECLEYMKWRGIDDCCIAFADKNFEALLREGRKGMLRKDIVSPEEAKRMDVPILVSIGGSRGMQ
ncbi:MAG: hypothetical protein IJT96_09200 [Lachnospiraceae bacterium]|nr:hypothetical protein [Lachnospiraceae bacterium]